MPLTQCPVCQSPLPATSGPEPLRFCPACRHPLNQPAPIGWQVGNVDLRTVARRQRLLLWEILAALLLNLGLLGLGGMPLWFNLLVGLFAVVVQIAVVVTVVSLLAALRVHIVWRIVYILLLFAPCISLLMLLSANARATRALKNAGLKVGLMGVRDEEVERILGPYRCRKCGYSLIGNLSGVCPECGTPGAATLPAAPGADHPRPG